MKILRSIVAIVGGWFAMALPIIAAFFVWVLRYGDPTETGVFPGTGFLLFQVGLGFLSAILGGFVAALLAPSRPLLHVLALVVIGWFLAFVSMVFSSNMATGEEPIWFQLSNPVVMLFGMPLGGWLLVSRRSP
ncbi:MAG: hypothetical protein O7B99_05000 [Planctomycetota bacterium]|nr:hypothetical protein [Planctomycetota bacterium]